MQENLKEKASKVTCGQGELAEGRGNYTGMQPWYEAVADSAQLIMNETENA